MLDSPVVSVHIPQVWRHYTDGQGEVTVSGDTVAEVLSALEHEHPGILGELLDWRGQLVPAVDVFVGGHPIEQLQGLETPIELEESVYLIWHEVACAASNSSSSTVNSRD